MRFSTKSKYGLKAMVDLANHYSKDTFSIKVIAERQMIPESYLEQLFSNLKKAGLITSIKGPNGGYRLALPPEKITVASVISSLDGELTVLEEKEQVTFQEDSLGYYVNMAVWERIDEQVQGLLESISLEDMKKGYQKLTSNDSYMYFI